MKEKRFLIIGAGFSGAVLARELTEKNPDCRCILLEKRKHVAGNCHTSRDPETGIMLHHHGPHIFNTNLEHVWNYINRIEKIIPYISRVKAYTNRGMLTLPINLLTINQIYGKQMNPMEAKSFLEEKTKKFRKNPQNLEEQALQLVGPEIYETLFRDYTIKQWGCDPKTLPASVIKRIPVRFNYDDNYYDKTFQGIPQNGYTKIIESLLNHPHIETRTETDFTPKNWEQTIKKEKADHLFFTGPIDSFFQYSKGRLSYRTVTFQTERFQKEDHQGCALINYPTLKVPQTRTLEHKHLTPWEQHKSTVVTTEFSKETQPEDTPYYPKRLSSDKIKLREYQILAENTPQVSFLGRLGTYRYLDMDKTIDEAIQMAEACTTAYLQGKPLPTFPKETPRN